MGIASILAPLGLLVFAAYRGWSVLLLAPVCAVLGMGVAAEFFATMLDAYI